MKRLIASLAALAVSATVALPSASAWPWDYARYEREFQIAASVKDGTYWERIERTTPFTTHLVTEATPGRILYLKNLRVSMELSARRWCSWISEHSGKDTAGCWETYPVYKVD
jgi:hypothetical protein